MYVDRHVYCGLCIIGTYSVSEWRCETCRCFVNKRRGVRVYTTFATTSPLFCHRSLCLIENIAYQIDDGIVNFNGTRLMSGESVKCFTYDSIQRLFFFYFLLFYFKIFIALCDSVTAFLCLYLVFMLLLFDIRYCFVCFILVCMTSFDSLQTFKGLLCSWWVNFCRIMWALHIFVNFDWN